MPSRSIECIVCHGSGKQSVTELALSGNAKTIPCVWCFGSGKLSQAQALSQQQQYENG